MTIKKYSGENILVIAPAHADRTGGNSKFGLSFDLMGEKKLQIDGVRLFANCKNTTINK